METTTVTSEHRPLPTTLTDPTFLQGLEVILQPYYDQGASEDEIRDVVKRAEAFYLSSHAPEDLEQPQPLSSLTTVPSVSSPSSCPQAPPSSSSDPPYPPTFAQLAALIATGAPIPGIKDIPDKLAEGEPSESRESVRRKPWEKEGGEAGGGGESGRAENGADEAMAEEGSGQV